MSKLEHSEQVELFRWAAKVAFMGFELADADKAEDKSQYKPCPELQMLFAIPNGGSRGDNATSRAIRGNQLKAEGVRAGVPDIFLAVPSKGFHGLFIELKRSVKKDSVVSDEQKRWKANLELHGYVVRVCYGAEEAKQLIKSYLGYDK